MKTITMTDEDMASHICHFRKIAPYKADYLGKYNVPIEAYEMFAAKSIYCLMAPENYGGQTDFAEIIGAPGLSVYIGECPPRRRQHAARPPAHHRNVFLPQRPVRGVLERQGRKLGDPRSVRRDCGAGERYPQLQEHLRQNGVSAGADPGRRGRAQRYRLYAPKSAPYWTRSSDRRRAMGSKRSVSTSPLGWGRARWPARRPPGAVQNWLINHTRGGRADTRGVYRSGG